MQLMIGIIIGLCISMTIGMWLIWLEVKDKKQQENRIDIVNDKNTL